MATFDVPEIGDPPRNFVQGCLIYSTGKSGGGGYGMPFPALVALASNEAKMTDNACEAPRSLFPTRQHLLAPNKHDLNDSIISPFDNLICSKFQ